MYLPRVALRRPGARVWSVNLFLVGFATLHVVAALMLLGTLAWAVIQGNGAFAVFYGIAAALTLAAAYAFTRACLHYRTVAWREGAELVVTTEGQTLRADASEVGVMFIEVRPWSVAYWPSHAVCLTARRWGADTPVIFGSPLRGVSARAGERLAAHLSLSPPAPAQRGPAG